MMSSSSQLGAPPPTTATAAATSVATAAQVTVAPTATSATAKISTMPVISSAVSVAGAPQQPQPPTMGVAVTTPVDAAAAAARAAALTAAGKGVGVNLGAVVHTGTGHHVGGTAMTAAETKADATVAVAAALAVPRPDVVSNAPNVPQQQPQPHLQYPPSHPPATMAHPPMPPQTATFPPAAPLQQNTPLPATPVATPTAATATPNQKPPATPAIVPPPTKVPPNVTFPLKRSCAAMGLARDGKPLTEKKLRRLEKNRLSARECRRRKREAAQNLEKEINVLEGENLRLRLQLQIGEEAENSTKLEQEQLMEGLDDLLKSGSASESDIYATIEQYKEKFSDYGRNRRSAIEFHLRNLARLLMPTTTTSVAIRALHGGSAGGFTGLGGGGAGASAGAGAGAENGNVAAKVGTGVDVVGLVGNSAGASTANGGIAASVPEPVNAASEGVSVVESKVAETVKEDGVVNPLAAINGGNAEAASVPHVAGKSGHGSDGSNPAVEPKALFQYLVNYLEVTPTQAAALKDSRSVARELDSALVDSLGVLDELRDRLTKCGEDLEAEFNSVRAILSPTQAAKFLIWVANNGACMHMLNELWSKVYPDLENSEEDDDEEQTT